MPKLFLIPVAGAMLNLALFVATGRVISVAAFAVCLGAAVFTFSTERETQRLRRRSEELDERYRRRMDDLARRGI